MDFDVKKDTDSPAYLLFEMANKKNKPAEPVESSEDDNENPNLVK